MALEGTHIRLALDVQDLYEIEDLGRYLSGTIYPDSRYVTKSERSLTHSDKYLQKEFATDDFRRGWQAHLRYDEIQNDMIADLVNPSKKEISQNDDMWVNATAIKILQEINDIENFEVGKYLASVKMHDNPNKESMEKLESYCGFLKNFYGKSAKSNPEDYREVFYFFGIPEEVGNKVLLKCKEFGSDPLMIEKIAGIYDKSLEMFRHSF